MKKSVRYLPHSKQRDLKRFVEVICEKLPHTEMIILYGSYARNTYVDYDTRTEFGMMTSYRSDYDILVVTSQTGEPTMQKALDRIEDEYTKYNNDRQTPVQFIFDNIRRLNEQLRDGRYFYTQIKKEGIMLYDSGNFKLARRRKLRFGEIAQQTKEYFEDKFGLANDFLDAVDFFYNKDNYRMASFNLHQAAENYLFATRLVFTLDNPKLHDLERLMKAVRPYSDAFRKVFPCDTTEEKRLFTLLRSAYIGARYNPEFVVTKEDLDALLPRVKQLRDVAEHICLQQIEAYKAKLTRPVEE